MKKVLIVTYVFPPVGGAGVQRTLKWTRHLAEFGWTPCVLTAKNPSVPLTDAALEAEIPGDLRIVRTRTFEPPYRLKRKAWNRAEAIGDTRGRTSLLSVAAKAARALVQRVLSPDPQVGWNLLALPAARRLVERERIDAVVTSAPPFSTHLLGLMLARATGLPWVADFRDEWVEFYTRAYDFHRRGSQSERIEAMEREVATRASALVTVTASILENYRRRYPRLDATNSFWIPNGFDEADFRDAPPPADPERFTLVYAGTVFGVTSAAPFLGALKELLARRPDLEPILRVRFIGRIDPKEEGPFHDPALAPVLERTGYLPHDEALRAVRSADALLILLSDLPGSERILTGKIFEYLAARRPILAVVPPGEISRLVDGEKAGTAVSPRDGAAVSRALEAMADAWKRGAPPKPAGDVGRFSRRETAKSLASVLDRLTRPPQ